MKKVFLILLVLSHWTVSAQSGIYSRGSLNQKADGAIIKWTLSLHPDGTFLYHFLRDLSAISPINVEEKFYGKGTWKPQGKQILFFSEKEDMDEEYTVNLNNSKARYITKSPRDTSDKIVKTALRFYASETFHIKGLVLFKDE